MNRPIKFRVWDKLNKKMIVDEDNLLISLSGDVVKVWDDGEWANTINGLNYILMQSTGLKDKNGKDIYDGDIVRIANFPNDFKRSEPEFDWRVFQVIWNKNVYAFENSVIYTPFSSYSGSNLEEYDIEIIGNIYKNPEWVMIIK